MVQYGTMSAVDRDGSPPLAADTPAVEFVPEHDIVPGYDHMNRALECWHAPADERDAEAQAGPAGLGVRVLEDVLAEHTDSGAHQLFVEEQPVDLFDRGELDPSGHDETSGEGLEDCPDPPAKAEEAHAAPAARSDDDLIGEAARPFRGHKAHHLAAHGVADSDHPGVVRNVYASEYGEGVVRVVIEACVFPVVPVNHGQDDDVVAELGDNARDHSVEPPANQLGVGIAPGAGEEDEVGGLLHQRVLPVSGWGEGGRFPEELVILHYLTKKSRIPIMLALII